MIRILLFFSVFVTQPVNSANDDDVVIGAPSYFSGTFTAVATYTHDGSETTSDTFTFKANDGDGDSNTATATITIAAVNDAPVASAAVNGSGSEDGTISTTLTATDVDDTDPTDFFSIVTQPTNTTGDVTIVNPVTYDAGSNTFTAVATYTHDGSQTTSDSFTYKANDGDDDSITETATITIAAINDSPVAKAVNSSGNEGGIITTTLIATDVDDTDPTDFFSIVTQPTNSANDDNVVIGTVNYASGTFTAVATLYS